MPVLVRNLHRRISNPQQLLRRAELSDPAHAVDTWPCYSVKPPISRPKLATKAFGQCQIMGIVDRALPELACKYQCPAMKMRCLVQCNPQRHQVLHEICRNLYRQITSNHSTVKCICHLKGHKRGCGWLDTLINPKPGQGSGFIRVLFFHQPFESHACINNGELAHAHSSISASLISRASRIRSAESSESGLPPKSSARRATTRSKDCRSKR